MPEEKGTLAIVETVRHELKDAVVRLGTFNEAMQFVTDEAFLSSEKQIQHKDLPKTRLAMDHKDFDLVLKYLLDRRPFSGDESLRFISSGSCRGH